MIRNFSISAHLVAGILCLLSHKSVAQAQNKPLMCNEANNIDINATQFQGIWWEVAANPPPTDNLSCVKYTIDAIAYILSVGIQFSTNAQYPWVNQTNVTSVSLSNSNPQGYNITMNYLNTPPTTIKFLATDYTNYALICGFQNISDVNSYFGIILTRERTMSATYLNYLQIMAAANYSQFLDGSMAKIYQQEACYDSNLIAIEEGSGGGSSALPILSSILAFFYAFMMWI